MTEFETQLSLGELIGIVADNNDPDKKQRVRIRVPYLHGDNTHIPDDALPWAQPKRDNNGLMFSVPEVGKVINVTYPNGNLYFPVYDNAQHLNVNLQKKIETYSGDDYNSFVALCYNHNTQIFIDNTNLIMYYKNNGIKITEDDITIIKKNANNKILLGNDDADEPIILGDKFFKWFDSFMDNIQLFYQTTAPGSPVAPTPALANIIATYKGSKPTFLSKSIFAIANDNTTKNKVDVVEQIGDKVDFTTPNNKALKANVTSVDNKKTDTTSSNTTDNTAPVEVKEVVPENMPKTNTIPEVFIDVSPTLPDVVKPVDTTAPKSILPPENVLKIPETKFILPETEDDMLGSTNNTVFQGSDGNLESDTDGYDFFTDVDYSEYDDDAASSDLGELPNGSLILSYNYASNKFNIPNKKTNCDNTYRLVLDANKLPQPKLTKAILINWKLQAEGGISNATTDSAAGNPANICPIPDPVSGKIRVHTNKGVTYSVWKSVFGSTKATQFLTMSHDNWTKVFDEKYWNKHAKSEHESVNCLLVSFAWGGSKDICVKRANELVGGNFKSKPEKVQVAALLSARAQLFVNLSQPNKRNNVYRAGWLNAVNNLLKKVYG